jgi:hypothetical protein
MATPTVANIILGGALVYYAPVAETVPDETTVTAGTAWGGNWARVGYTKAPVTFQYEDEHFKAEVEEELTAVKGRRISENATLETVLAEVTAAYLNLAMGGTVTSTAAGAGQAANESLPVGGTATLPFYAYGFEGTYVNSSGVSFPVRFFIHKGVAKLNGPLTFSNRNSEYPGISLSIEAYADTTQSAGGKLFRFERVTAVATS